MTTPRFTPRLMVAGLSAVSAGLSLVIISASKVLLLIAALLFLLRRRKPPAEAGEPLRDLWAPKLVLLILLAFASSLIWTSAPIAQALGAMGKYGKFLVIPALLILLRTRRDASFVLAAFLTGQAFLLISSWLLFLKVPVPWATSNMAWYAYSVFSSYLDQGVMSAVMAAVFWHLRTLMLGRILFYVATALSLLALAAVFILFRGRTGHLVGVAMISLAIFWASPQRYRLATLLIPPLICLVAFFSFDKVAQRFSMVGADLSAYSAQSNVATSSGVRLGFWKTSAEAIAKNPFLGSGAGSWGTEYNRIKHAKNAEHVNVSPGSNPHQEFLQWGVQLGMGGILLLLAFMGAAALDFSKMESPVARAGLSVVAGLVVSCMFNSSLYDAYIGDFFCLALGVLLAYGFHGGIAVARQWADVEEPVRE